MTIFKLKDSKIKFASNVQSLDLSHTNFISNLTKKKNMYEKKNNLIPFINEKIKLHDINNLHNVDYLEERNKLIDEIESITKNIEDLNYNELNYYSKTHEILTNYYELDNAYEIENNVKEEKQEDTKEVKQMSKLELLNLITQQKKKTQKKKTVVTKTISNNIFNYIDDKKNQNNNLENTEKIVNKSTLYNDYDYLINHKSIKIDNNLCQTCNTSKIFYYDKGFQACTLCNEIEKFKPEIDVTDYNESRIKKPKLAYEKKNHFFVWLTHFQARESKYISDEIVNVILNEIKKYNYSKQEIKSITDNNIIKILKKLDYNKYYKNLSYIRYKITGIKPPAFTKEEENLLIHMFNLIEAPFYKHKPAKRKNFLSYSYILYKFCEKIKYDALENNDIEKCKKYSKYLKLLILLKRKNLREQDAIWKKICNELGWIYYSSL